MGLYSSITDNGAGGLSCSVAEMARECGGFEVDLETVPLKYPGLAPWQIWVSESQERMTLSVPDESLATLLDLMERRGVEATVIGRFTDSGRGIVRHHGRKGLRPGPGVPPRGTAEEDPDDNPQRRNPSAAPSSTSRRTIPAAFLDMAGRLNTASFEFISTQYDHEVQANSVIKPLQGRGRVNGGRFGHPPPGGLAEGSGALPGPLSRLTAIMTRTGWRPAPLIRRCATR